MNPDVGLGLCLGLIVLVLLSLIVSGSYLCMLHAEWIGTTLSYVYLGEVRDFEVSSTKCKVELTNGEKLVVNDRICYDLVTGKSLYQKKREGWFGDTYEKYEVVNRG